MRHNIITCYAYIIITHTMRISFLYLIFFFLPLLFQAQSRIRPVYGFYMNNSLEHITSRSPELKTYNARALGFYFNLGLQKELDSVFVIQASLRYGRERSSFEVYRNGVILKDYYYFSNQTLILFLSPGLSVNKRQKLFLTLGAGRFYQSNVGGSGVKATGFGQRSYTYAIHLNRNSMDYRLGLKWQVKPGVSKKINFEIGAETSWLQHQSIIEVTSSYNNQPGEFYKLNFSMILVYVGINFSKTKHY